MPIRHLDKATFASWVGASALIVLSATCGPPLGDPSSHNISGRWSTKDSIGPVSQILMDLTQNPDGTVQGKWSGKLFPLGVSCPPGLNATPTGSVTGTNTVLEVRLAILGTGDFDGQAVGNQTLQGGLLSCGVVYPVIFSLIGPVPGG